MNPFLTRYVINGKWPQSTLPHTSTEILHGVIDERRERETEKKRGVSPVLHALLSCSQLITIHGVISCFRLYVVSNMVTNGVCWPNWFPSSFIRPGACTVVKREHSHLADDRGRGMCFTFGTISACFPFLMPLVEYPWYAPTRWSIRQSLQA